MKPVAKSALASQRLHRFDIGMTKAENRAAARAWHQERLQEMREEARAMAVTADLEELRRLRHHLIFHSQAGGPHEDLLDAIDLYVERLTGDPRMLQPEPVSDNSGVLHGRR